MQTLAGTCRQTCTNTHGMATQEGESEGEREREMETRAVFITELWIIGQTNRERGVSVAQL